jgi:methylated-DNA-protein-cysteine methyltransferase-like protein
MDRLNIRLRDLLQARARLAVEIAHWKAARGLRVPDAARERDMLARLLLDPPEGFDHATLERLLRAVLRASRQLATRQAAAPRARRASPRAETFERIYRVVRRIPRGRVATYGQVAALAGFPSQPRLAGYALHALPHDTDVPWHRVVNAAGRLSLPKQDGHYDLQRALLVGEKVAFVGDRIDLARHQWRR